MKRIITDSINLESKEGISKDSFYSDKKDNTIKSDSKAGSSIYKGDHRFFALLSTAGKEINNRSYDDASWERTVMDGTWQGKPYSKPILRNHDLYYSNPSGRILDSYFVKHEDLQVKNKDNNTIPSDVLKHFTDSGCFADGTSSVIVEFSADAETADRIINNLDITVSQSSFMNSASCSVCGNDYYKGTLCSHVAGRTYELEQDGVTKQVKCIVHTKDYDPIELSIVNLPANDTSIIFAYKPKSKSSKDSEGDFSHENEGKIDDNKIPVQNVQDNSSQEGISEGTQEAEPKTNDQKDNNITEDSMWKQFAKDHYASKLKEKFNDNPELIEAFNDLFEATTTEQSPKLSLFLDKLVSLELEAKAKDSEGEGGAEGEQEGSTATAVTPETGSEGEANSDSGETASQDKEGEGEVPEAKVPEADAKGDVLKNVFGDSEIEKNKPKFEDKALLATICNLKF